MRTTAEDLTLGKMQDAQDKLNAMDEEERAISNWEKLFGRNTRAKLINFLMMKNKDELFTSLDVADAIDVKQVTAVEHLTELVGWDLIKSQVVENGQVIVFERSSSWIMEKLSELHEALFSIRTG